MPECTEFIFSNIDLVIKKMKDLLVVLSGKVICIFYYTEHIGLQ